MVGVHWTVEMIGSCPHIAVAVVLVCPHFPSLRYTLCLIPLMMFIYPFELIGSWPHVAMVVVMICPHFPSLRYVYILCLISLTMSSYVSFRNDRFMTSYGGSSWNFLRAGHRRKGSIRSERRKIMHALGWYGRDCRRCIWHVLPAVLKILEHDTGDIKALWSQSIYHVYRYSRVCTWY